MSTNLMILLLIVFIVLFVDSIVIFIVNSYNKLILQKNELTDNYKELYNEVNFKFNLAKQYLPYIKTYIDTNSYNGVMNLIDSFNTKVSITDVSNSYYSLNYMLFQINKITSQVGFSAPEWDKAFNDANTRIETARGKYDDNVLKMNNLISRAPTNMVAKMFGIGRWQYFRTA